MYTVVEFDLRVDLYGLVDDEAHVRWGASKYERSQERMMILLDSFHRDLAVFNISPILALMNLGPTEALILLPLVIIPGLFWFVWIQIFLWRFLKNIIIMVENVNALIKNKASNTANGK